MDINWIQDFVALSESGNFTRAAAGRNISQAAFSRRIKALEQWLGTTLIDRSTIPVSLTTQGRIFEKEAEEILARLHMARTGLTHNSSGAGASVEVTMSQVIASTSFATWWRRWSEGSNIKAATRIGNISDAVSDFLTGNSDILICHKAEHLPIMLDPRHFQSKFIAKDELRPYCAANSRFASRIANPAKGDPIPLIMYKKGMYFARLVDGLIEQSQQPFAGSRVVESEMVQVVMECVVADMGIGWLPSSAVNGKNRELLRPIDIQDISLQMDIVAFTHRRKRSPAADAIWARIS